MTANSTMATPNAPQAGNTTTTTTTTTTTSNTSAAALKSISAMRLDSTGSRQTSLPASSSAPSSVVSCGSSDVSTTSPRDNKKNIEVAVSELPSNYRPTTCPSLTPPNQGGARKGFNLFVGTLPNITTQEALEILFAPFGQLRDTYLLKQEGKGRYRCGFVSYAEYHSAAHAIARLNGFRWYTGASAICVRFANPQKAGADAAKEAAAAGTVQNVTRTGVAPMNHVDYASMLLNAAAQSNQQQQQQQQQLQVQQQQQQIANINNMNAMMSMGLVGTNVVPESPISSSASIGPDSVTTGPLGVTPELASRAHALMSLNGMSH